MDENVFYAVLMFFSCVIRLVLDVIELKYDYNCFAVLFLIAPFFFLLEQIMSLWAFNHVFIVIIWHFYCLEFVLFHVRFLKYCFVILYLIDNKCKFHIGLNTLAMILIESFS